MTVYRIAKEALMYIWYNYRQLWGMCFKLAFAIITVIMGTLFATVPLYLYMTTHTIVLVLYITLFTIALMLLIYISAVYFVSITRNITLNDEIDSRLFCNLKKPIVLRVAKIKIAIFSIILLACAIVASVLAIMYKVSISDINMLILAPIGSVSAIIIIYLAYRANLALVVLVSEKFDNFREAFAYSKGKVLTYFLASILAQIPIAIIYLIPDLIFYPLGLVIQTGGSEINLLLIPVLFAMIPFTVFIDIALPAIFYKRFIETYE